MRRPLTLALAAFLAVLPTLSAATADPLELAWDSILQQAARERTCLLVAFLGDGWSVASTRFSTDILESTSFKDFAKRELLVCPVLARVEPPLPKDQAARLQSLVRRFDIKAYPTFILLYPDGSEILRHGYKDFTAEAYVTLLESLLPEKPSAQLSN